MQMDVHVVNMTIGVKHVRVGTTWISSKETVELTCAVDLSYETRQETKEEQTSRRDMKPQKETFQRATCVTFQQASFFVLFLACAEILKKLVFQAVQHV